MATYEVEKKMERTRRWIIAIWIDVAEGSARWKSSVLAVFRFPVLLPMYKGVGLSLSGAEIVEPVN
jgi:hypothetical protein